MKQKCKKCNCNSEGEYCFRHKPKTPLAKKSSLSAKKLDKSPDKWLGMIDLFMTIWKKRLHLSEVSGLPLVGEPLSIYFHHILPKEKYPQACMDEENIILLTLEEHDQVEMDMYRYDEVNTRREKLLTKYNLK